MSASNFDFERDFELFDTDKQTLSDLEVAVVKSFNPSLTSTDIDYFIYPNISKLIYPRGFVGRLTDITISFISEASESLAELSRAPRADTVKSLVVAANCRSTLGNAGYTRTQAWYFRKFKHNSGYGLCAEDGVDIARRTSKPYWEPSQEYTSSLRRMKSAPGMVGGSAKGREKHSRMTGIGDHTQQREI